MKNVFIIILLLANGLLFSQIHLDSLEKEVVNIRGKEKVKLLTDLCWYLGAESPERAQNYGEEAILIAKNNQYDTLLAQAYNDLGTLYIRIGKYEQAILYFDSCIVKRKILKDDLGIAKVISKLAVIDEIRSDYESALKKNLEILKIFENIGKDKLAISTLYGNIAVILYNMNQFDKSIEFNDKCYVLANELDNKQSISTALVNYGNAYTKKNEIYKAINYFKQALPFVTEINNTHSYAVILNNLGSSFSRLNIHDSAEYYFNKSLPIREKINDKKGVMSTHTSLGNIYRIQKKYDKAIEVLNEALIVSEELKTKENTKVIYLNLSQVYDEIGKYDLAYKYHVMFSNLKDSIWSDESSTKIAEMETKYETEKKDIEINMLNKENALEKEKVHRQQLQLFGSAIGILLLILLSIVIFRGYSQKKKANEIITNQNEELNQYNEEILTQRDEIESQKNVIEEKHNEIQSSITYAKRIQTALLTTDEHWSEISPEHFILFRPKDVVSGDFFWAYSKDDLAIWVAADCTGHGVPGAFMSMLGVGFLNEIVAEGGITEANEILDILKEKIVTSLTQKGVDDQPNDGMDIAICVLDKKTKKLQYSGAYNPLYVVRDNQLLEYKANKQPIGKIDIKSTPFDKKEIQLEKEDWIYTFSDGFIDQFGGENNKRFGSRKFKELLQTLSGNDAHMQKMSLNLTLKEWMNSGGEDQVDDICVVGVKIV